MGKQRRTWSTELKEAIVLSVLRGEVSTAEVARQHGVNESLVHTWKASFLDAGRARLAGERQDNGQATLERENDHLKRIVAEKELELDISRKVRRQHRGH
jgi:transposase